jgi:hypothetical protein
VASMFVRNALEFVLCQFAEIHSAGGARKIHGLFASFMTQNKSNSAGTVSRLRGPLMAFPQWVEPFLFRHRIRRVYSARTCYTSWLVM